MCRRRRSSTTTRTLTKSSIAQRLSSALSSRIDETAAAPCGAQSAQTAGTSDRLPSGRTTRSCEMPLRLKPPTTIRRSPSNACFLRVMIIEPGRWSWRWVVCRVFVRPSEPRCPDGTRGTQGHRQTGAATDPPLPAGWVDDGRDGNGTQRRDPARRSTLAAVVECPAR